MSTPKINPVVSTEKKELKMSANMERFKLAITKSAKKVKFVGEDVDVMKLTVAQVLEIQAAAKDAETTTDDASSIKMLYLVLRMGVAEFAEATDEEFACLPMDELSKLSAEILKFSGLGNDSKK